jgi:glycosyltransferase involved in cell wall biosynthesis
LKISIITVCLNNSKEIQETVESVLSQKYKNIEYIVIDGGSNDGSIEIIQSYASKIDYFVSEADNGIYSAINKGLSMAQGEIVGLLHGGDVFYDNNVISNIAKCFNEDNFDLIYGHSIVYSKNRKRVIRRNMSPEYKTSLMKFGWFPSHQSVYIKSHIIKKYGNYNETYKIAADYEFLLRLLNINNIKVKRLDKFLLKFYLGGASSKNIMSVLKSNYECYRAWKNNNLKISFYTIPLKISRKFCQNISNTLRFNKNG